MQSKKLKTIDNNVKQLTIESISREKDLKEEIVYYDAIAYWLCEYSNTLENLHRKKASYGDILDYAIFNDYVNPIIKSFHFIIYNRVSDIYTVAAPGMGMFVRKIYEELKRQIPKDILDDITIKSDCIIDISLRTKPFLDCLTQRHPHTDKTWGIQDLENNTIRHHKIVFLLREHSISLRKLDSADEHVLHYEVKGDDNDFIKHFQFNILYDYHEDTPYSYLSKSDEYINLYNKMYEELKSQIPRDIMYDVNINTEHNSIVILFNTHPLLDKVNQPIDMDKLREATLIMTKTFSQLFESSLPEFSEQCKRISESINRSNHKPKKGGEKNEVCKT